VNFMDGINGISAAQAVVGGLAYALVGHTVGDRALLGVGLVTAAAMAAFAPFNVPRARVFLGDTGSYGLGAALAGLAVLALFRGLPPEAALGPLLPYLADTGSTIVRRMAAGEAWYQPHRSHVYQRLTGAGYSHVQVSVAVGLLVALTSGLGAVSLVGHGGGRLLADLAMVALLSGYLASPELLSRRRVKFG
jgi:UDP-N-acetylmuramyl pentapeptide phosphotransferase/UDP-N-acetylglucosamine-1-phosphate transferase